MGLSLLFYLFGVGAICAGLNYARIFYRRSRFPWVEGALLEKRIIRAWSTDAEGGGGWRYYPTVSYAYRVADQSYTSTCFYDFGAPSYMFESWAVRCLASLEVGRPLRVRYDPARPAFCFLRQGPWMMIWFPPLLGLVFCTVAWWMRHHA